MISRLDEQGAEEMLAQERALLYKHSPTCWISSMAAVAVQHFATDHPSLPVYQVDVLRDRPLSQAMARRLGVPHESPQVILLRNGEPVWSASHMEIAYEELVRRAGGAPEE